MDNSENANFPLPSEKSRRLDLRFSIFKDNKPERVQPINHTQKYLDLFIHLNKNTKLGKYSRLRK